MSHYAEYMKEAFGREIIEDESGFITFHRLPDALHICYFVDIYVAPAFRKQGHVVKLEGMATEWAKAQGCTKILGSVNMRLGTPERSMVEMIKLGYKLSHVNGEMIYFYKDIQGEA